MAPSVSTTTNADEWMASRGMDRAGVLLADVRMAARDQVRESEPLFHHDDELKLQLDRFLGLAGVGHPNSFLQSLPELRRFYGELERELLALLPGGVRLEGDGLPGLTVSGAISSIVDRVHRTELCVHLARNGSLSEADFRRTSTYLDRLEMELLRAGDTLAGVIGDTDPRLIGVLAELSEIPDRIRRRGSLHFEVTRDTKIEPGDIVSFRGSIDIAVLHESRGTQVHGIAHDYSGYREISIDLSASPINELTVTRGIRPLALSSEALYSASQPVRVGLHVVRAPGSQSNSWFEMGEVVECIGSDRAKVLWRLGDGGFRVESLMVDALRVAPSAADRSSLSRWHLQGLFREGAESPLCTLVAKIGGGGRESNVERDARELQTLCTRVIQSEYPLALHVVGRVRPEDERLAALTEFASRVVSLSRGGLPKDDAEHLVKHGCTPVLVVLNSEDNATLSRDLARLQGQGWKVVICPRRDDFADDHFVKQAVIDLTRQSKAEPVDVVIPHGPSLGEILDRIGRVAFARLDETVPQRDRRDVDVAGLHVLSTSLDCLAEADPLKAVTLRPREFAKLRAAVTRLKMGDSSGAEEFAKHVEANFGGGTVPRFGAVHTREKWSFRDLVEVSGALAKSRQEPNHPAVLLRGITCLDLSPSALATLLGKGAEFLRIENSTRTTRGLIISLSPAAVDAAWPALSPSLGRPNGVGFVFWVWCDPASDREVRFSYPKLINALTLHQLVDEASFIFGRVLERNAPSLRAARSIGGFDVVPSRVMIGGEPAVGVGFDLSRSDVEPEPARPTARAIVNEAFDLFAAGLDLQLVGQPHPGARARLLAAHEFLVRQHSFRESCDKLLEQVTPETSWSDCHRLISNAEAALGRLEPWISEGHFGELRDSLAAATDDDERSRQFSRIGVLIREVAPEDVKDLRRVSKQLREKALEHYGIELDAIVSDDVAGTLRRRSPLRSSPPTLDLAEARRGYPELSPDIQRALDSWWSSFASRFAWVGDEHPDRYSCHRHVREWIEDDVAEHGHFAPHPRMFANSDGQLSMNEREHLRSIGRVIDWANEIAREGYFDKHAARTAWVMLGALFGQDGEE